jgi:hypothetical protein
VIVDYYSVCNHTTNKDCVNIKCETQPNCPHNYHHRLPHNCCPICGSVAKILYLKNNNNAEYSELNSNYYKLTVEQLANALRSVVQIFGCHLYSYLSIDGFIMAIVKPNVMVPTERHLRQCHQELVRIVTLINNHSPIISLQFPLSLLIMAEIVTLDYDISEVHSNYCNTKLFYSPTMLVVIYLLSFIFINFTALR